MAKKARRPFQGATVKEVGVDGLAVDFIAYWQTAVPPGKYQMQLKQAVTTEVGGDPTDFLSDPKTLVVLGERFQLPPNIINTTFPPNGVLGRYDTCLPHVVLNRKTLPWERRIDGDVLELGPMASDNMQTWLAVVVLDEDDFSQGEFPDTISGTLADLVASSQTGGLLPANTYFPDFMPDADAGESLADPCTYIDIPASLFNIILPSSADLSWTAHGRAVSVENKATPRYAGTRKVAPHAQFSIQEDLLVGDYSVVMANRFPKAGNRTRVHLVSLENYGSVLRPNSVSGKDFVRLVSLHSWAFQCFDAEDGFGHRMQNLNNAMQDNPWLVVPPLPNKTSTNQAVLDAIAMGYTPFNHLTRTANIDGKAVTPNKMVSWYRSPLISFDLAPHLDSVQDGLPFGSADAVSRYNPNTGMFDITYAAAWQLGELLGLQDKAYSTALYQYKRNTVRSTINALEQQILNDALGFLPVDPDAEESLLYRTLGGKISQSLQAFNRGIPKTRTTK